MINFPIFRTLEIANYELYPASFEKPFLVDFQAGPNLIVGVNGSGKTTLIGILYRCLTGPFDLPSATSETELGQIRARSIPFTKRERQLFGARVSDGACEATATLCADFGSRHIEFTRSLADLSLTALSVDGKKITFGKTAKQDDIENSYHHEICNLFGVGSFFDVLIILRFLIFMTEDRRALVWDPSAQRQIFRVLMLPPARAKEYAEAQQEVISADSKLRNTNQMIRRLRERVEKAAKQADQIQEIESQRRLKLAEAEAVREKLEVASEARVSADQERKKYRLDRLRAIESRESLARELERIKTEALRHWLGSTQDNALYILGQLFADGQCLVCNSKSSPVSEEINERLRTGLCPICGSRHEGRDDVVSVTEVDKARIRKIEEEISLASHQVLQADRKMQLAQRQLDEHELEFIGLENRRVSIDRELVEILRKIPAEQAAIDTENDAISSNEAIAKEDRHRLKLAEERFTSIVAESLESVQRLQDQIAETFSNYLKLFLKESATLVYQPVTAKVGQGGGGARFTFPAFRLAMTGGAIAGETIRDEPSDVSLSQAEFVDLAFRMALLSIAAENHSSSLVVDAPEASLDFLFARRAGDQLAAFSWATPTNRVIITSYLPSKHLVTAFLEKVSSTEERTARIVDLIQLAADNAALRTDREKYARFLEEVVNQHGLGDD